MLAKRIRTKMNMKINGRAIKVLKIRWRILPRLLSDNRTNELQGI